MLKRKGFSKRPLMMSIMHMRLHMCDISDLSVFDINKDVHEVLIDDISEDDNALSPHKPTTLVEEPHVKEIKDGEF